MKYNKALCKSKLLNGYTGCMCEYCLEYSNQKGQWIPVIHGSKTRGFEISIVRKTDRHGQQSWGWFGETKMLIAEGEEVCASVWQSHLNLAKVMAKARNEMEKK